MRDTQPLVQMNGIFNQGLINECFLVPLFENNNAPTLFSSLLSYYSLKELLPSENFRIGSLYLTKNGKSRIVEIKSQSCQQSKYILEKVISQSFSVNDICSDLISFASKKSRSIQEAASGLLKIKFLIHLKIK